jgi:hypothetical protein
MSRVNALSRYGHLPDSRVSRLRASAWRRLPFGQYGGLAHTWVGILNSHVGLAQVLLILSAMVFHRQCKHWKIGEIR